MISQSGQAAHPSELIANYEALLAHLKKEQNDADKVVEAWKEDLAAKELADNRRRAPGWLDTQQRILEPVRQSGLHSTSDSTPKRESIHELGMTETAPSRPEPDEGDELDRAFGMMSTQ